MSSKFGEIIKKLISVFGEKPGRGLPATPHPTASRFRGLYTWRKRNIRTQTRNPPTELGRGEKGRGGENNVILNNLITKQYLDAISSQEDVHSLSSPYCIDKLCSSPFCVAGK
jgi:hypothetical protein